jgi:hypothetical protein
VFDPKTNARMAVWKYKHQGLGAWEAFTLGMHRRFLAKGGVLGKEGDLAKATGLAQGGVVGRTHPMGWFHPPNNLELVRRDVALAKRTGIPSIDTSKISRFSGEVARAGEMADLATHDVDERRWVLKQLKAQLALRNWVVRAVKDSSSRQSMLSQMLASFQGRQREISRKRHPTRGELALRHALPGAIQTVRSRRDSIAKQRSGYWDQLNKLQGTGKKAAYMRGSGLPELGALGGSTYLTERRFYDLDPTRLIERSLGGW